MCASDACASTERSAHVLHCVRRVPQQRSATACPSTQAPLTLQANGGARIPASFHPHSVASTVPEARAVSVDGGDRTVQLAAPATMVANASVVPLIAPNEIYERVLTVSVNKAQSPWTRVRTLRRPLARRVCMTSSCVSAHARHLLPSRMQKLVRMRSACSPTPPQ